MSVKNKRQVGFTVVELLIVIVVIAILAVISVVVYNGFTRRAKESLVQSDLEGARKQVEMYRAINGSLPLTDNCPSPGATEVCLTGSEGTVFTYLPNSSTNPTSYELLAANDDISYLFDGSSSRLAHGSRVVTLTNLIENGDFSAGSTRWTGQQYCRSPTQCLFDGGVLTINADPLGESRVMQYIETTYTDGDIIFYSARARRDGGSDFEMHAHRTSGGYGSYMLSAAQFNAAPIGQFVRYSGVRTFLASQGSFTGFRAGVSSAGREFQATVDDVVAINLTATFGAGNEPTVSEMESILHQFENGYFSGSVTATY